MNQSVLEIADRLSNREVTYAIIGGHAVNYYGYIRATEDVDIVFLRDAKSEVAIYETLAELGAFWITDDLDPATGLERVEPISPGYVKANSMLMLGTKVGYVDLFDFLPGFDASELTDFFSCVEVSQGRKFTSLAWLKRLKLAADRPQDRMDLKNLP